MGQLIAFSELVTPGGKEQSEAAKEDTFESEVANAAEHFINLLELKVAYYLVIWLLCSRRPSGDGM